MDFLEQLYGSNKMSSCLWKMGLRFWAYGLISPLGPNCPKSTFRPQTANDTVLGSEFLFMSSTIKFFMKQALIFKFWVMFDKVMSVYYQNNPKKPIKNLIFGAIQDM